MPREPRTGDQGSWAQGHPSSHTHPQPGHAKLPGSTTKQSAHLDSGGEEVGSSGLWVGSEQLSCGGGKGGETATLAYLGRASCPQAIFGVPSLPLLREEDMCVWGGVLVSPGLSTTPELAKAASPF